MLSAISGRDIPTILADTISLRLIHFYSRLPMVTVALTHVPTPSGLGGPSFGNSANVARDRVQKSPARSRARTCN